MDIELLVNLLIILGALLFIFWPQSRKGDASTQEDLPFEINWESEETETSQKETPQEVLSTSSVATQDEPVSAPPPPLQSNDQWTPQPIDFKPIDPLPPAKLSESLTASPSPALKPAFSKKSTTKGDEPVSIAGLLRTTPRQFFLAKELLEKPKALRQDDGF